MSTELLHTDGRHKLGTAPLMLDNIRRMLNHKVHLSDEERQKALDALLERILNPDKSQMPDDLAWWAGYFDEMELSKEKDTYRFVCVP